MDKIKANPRNLWTGAGKEFVNKSLHSCLEAKTINSYHCYGQHKIAHVDRVIEHSTASCNRISQQATQSTDRSAVLGTILGVL